MRRSLIILLLIPVFSFAQETNPLPFRLVLSGGAEMTQEFLVYRGVALDRSTSYGTVPTFPVSASISYPILDNIYLKSGIDYSKKKIANDKDVISGSQGILRISEFKCFDIPMQIGFVLNSKESDEDNNTIANFEIGAYYSSLREAKYELFDIENDKKVGEGEGSYKFPVGVVVGLNWVTGQFIAGFDFKYSLSKDENLNSNLFGVQFKVGLVF